MLRAQGPDGYLYRLLFVYIYTLGWHVSDDAVNRSVCCVYEQLADFGLAIEVQGEQQSWFGKFVIITFDDVWC